MKRLGDLERIRSHYATLSEDTPMIVKNPVNAGQESPSFSLELSSNGK